MKRYEVFDPVTARTVCRVPFAALASLICKLFARVHFFDYAREGEGWPGEGER